MTAKHTTNESETKVEPNTSTEEVSPSVDQDMTNGPEFTPSNVLDHGRHVAVAYQPVNAASLSRNNEDYLAASREVTQRKKTQRKLLGAIGALLVVALAFGAGFWVFNYIDSVNRDLGFEDAAEGAAVKEALTTTVSNEPFYIMLIGSDTRHDAEGGQRSDTNIVARVDPVAGKITMISIPRDTAINIEGHGTEKFNAAYNYNGAVGAIKAAEELLGVKISHYAEVDFEGMVDLVDVVGGVDVDVPMPIHDANAGNVTLEAGFQHLNGEQALVFSRSRAYTTGDFQRTTNQRLLLQALVNKILELPATELPNVIKKAASNVSTDLGLTDIISYVQMFQGRDDLVVYSCMVPSETAEVDGTSYVICDTDGLRKVMNAVRNGSDPSIYIEDATANSSAEAEALGMESAEILVPD